MKIISFQFDSLVMPIQLLLPLRTFPQEKETDLTVICNLKYMVFDILGYSSTHPKVNIL